MPTTSPFGATTPPRLDQIATPKIRFGKHKGKYIHDLPTDYIEWCLKKTETDGSFLDHANWFVAELASRGITWTGKIDPLLKPAPWKPEKPANGSSSSKLLVIAELRSLMKACYGEMSKRYHPDRGGLDGQQQVVIDYHRALMHKLEEWEKSR